MEGTLLTDEEQRQMVPAPVVLDRDRLATMGLHALDRVCAATTYRDCPHIRTAIHRLKYRGMRAYASVLSSFVVGAFPVLPLETPATLSGVPLHWMRYCARGFNQSTLLAKELAETWNASYRNLLRKTRSTGSQVGRTGNERRQSLLGAFRLRNTFVLPRTVVLIDDLCTTGATLEECARVLKSAGVLHVSAVVVALG